MKNAIGMAAMLGMVAIFMLGGDATAQTVLSHADSMFVLHMNSIPQSDVVRSFSTTAWNIPDIYTVSMSESDLLRVLGHLDASHIEPIPVDTRIPDMGDFVYYYGANSNSPYEYSNGEWLQDMEFLENEVEWLNENFRLPYDVLVEAVECGEANAFYDPDVKVVTICYEFVDHLDYLWWANNEEELYEGEFETFVFDVVYETFYHEIGHAILDIYDIPYTGLEENVADQFAALMLSYTEGGQDIMYNVGTYYLYSSWEEYDTPYWGTHSVDLQRFYNISCLAYGQDPHYNRDLIDDGWLPMERAVWCTEEYEQVSSAFGHLLTDYTNGFFD